MHNFRIRLSTLMWMVTAVCCFIAGHQWHRKDAIKAGVSEVIVVDDGRNRILTMQQRIPEVFISDPKIVSVRPLSAYEVLIFGLKPGSTNLTVTTEDNKSTNYKIVVPDKYTVAVTGPSS